MNDDLNHNSHEVIRISILSLVDNKVTKLLQGLVEKDPDNRTFGQIASIAVNKVIYPIKIKDRAIKLIIFQPLSESFTNKLLKQFYNTSSAIFLFDKKNQQSFIAAKVFYQHFQELNVKRNPPVTFIELTNEDIEVIFSEPETLENHPKVSYYTINENNVDKFESIIKTLTIQYLDAKEHAEKTILAKLIHYTNENG
ncbi:MAG: hypothetical protein ACFE95_11450 [Candidatus Hodarchaeota archaeon]